VIYPRKSDGDTLNLLPSLKPKERSRNKHSMLRRRLLLLLEAKPRMKLIYPRLLQFLPASDIKQNPEHSIFHSITF
jgi:hypothetical protein